MTYPNPERFHAISSTMLFPVTFSSLNFVKNLCGAGSWKFPDSANSSSKFADFRKSSGNSILELISTPTKITGVHYVQVTWLYLFLN